MARRTHIKDSESASDFRNAVVRRWRSIWQRFHPAEVVDPEVERARRLAALGSARASGASDKLGRRPLRLGHDFDDDDDGDDE